MQRHGQAPKECCIYNGKNAVVTHTMPIAIYTHIHTAIQVSTGSLDFPGWHVIYSSPGLGRYFLELVTCPLLTGLGLGNAPTARLFRQPPPYLPSHLMLSKRQLLTPRVLHLTFAPTANIFINKRSSNKEGGDGRIQGKNSLCKTWLSCLVTTSWYKGERGGFLMDDMSFARAPSVVASTERGP